MNILYDFARSRMLSNDFDWANLPVVMIAWRGPYLFDPAHLTANEVLGAGGENVVVSLLFTSNMVRPGGYARSDTAVLPNVPVSTNPVTFLTLAESATLLTDMKLIAYIDEAQGLPFIPNGQDQNVQPDWGEMRGWFRP